ncbi:pyroglutamyl-peptidase I [Demequina globuliformis]|uniref:pyroglutamyl-peptidase I n=1 Tax=Demequina globuliformis TaxID=676202 RepID=UPI00078088BD|nr:pyroglutamyl-peptidase I [Demequina globuliformis]
MEKVLLTGFEPFAGAHHNPSGVIAREVARTWSGPGHVVAEVLPVEFERAPDALTAALERHRPDAVVALGLADGRTGITVEKVAINTVDASIADNAGRQLTDVPVIASGPTAYFSTLPIKAMVNAMRDQGVAAAVSYSAGTFVCNQIFYVLRHALEHTQIPAGFVHVPNDAATARPDAPGEPRPWIPRDAQVAALTAALRVVMERRGADATTVGGALH